MKPQTTNKKSGGSALPFLFRMTWRHSAGNRGRLVLVWILFVLVELGEVTLNPYIWAQIMNVVQTTGITAASLGTLLWLLVALIGTTILFWVMHGPGRVMECTNAFKVRLSYRKQLLRGVMTSPMEWHVENHSGDTIDKIEKGTTGLYQFAEESFQVIYSAVKLLASCAMLTYFFPASSLIVFVMMGITCLVVIRIDRVLVGLYRQTNKAENDISAKIFDAISNIGTVITLRVEKPVFDAVVQKTLAPFPAFYRSNVLNEVKWSATAVLGQVAVAVVMAAYFWAHVGAAGGVLVGEVYLLFRYLGNITDLLFSFTSMYGDIVKRRARVGNSEELASQFDEEGLTNHVLPKDWRKLAVSNLTFSYGDSAVAHLEDVSLTLERGKRYAFVGATGSGKTTMLKIMRDLYPPERLSLAVDGLPVPEGFAGIARAIALVPQSPEIFASTIRENLTMGAEYAPELVSRATDMACFTGVADALPKKLESSTKEKGVNLSGGEQQRLALARGLLASYDKEIVLLDEPTSSLDPATEAQVYENIFREFSEKTVVSSVHRLHLLPRFDCVVVFEKGKIVGSGTVPELLETCPQFATLWEHQKSVEDLS